MPIRRIFSGNNPFFNEKLSRIRKSFCAEVHESVASHYIIQGSRGEERYITLNEELLVADEWLR